MSLSFEFDRQSKPETIRIVSTVDGNAKVKYIFIVEKSVIQRNKKREKFPVILSNRENYC